MQKTLSMPLLVPECVSERLQCGEINSMTTRCRPPSVSQGQELRAHKDLPDMGVIPECSLHPC